MEQMKLSTQSLVPKKGDKPVIGCFGDGRMSSISLNRNILKRGLVGSKSVAKGIDNDATNLFVNRNPFRLIGDCDVIVEDGTIYETPNRKGFEGCSDPKGPGRPVGRSDENRYFGKDGVVDLEIWRKSKGGHLDKVIYVMKTIISEHILINNGKDRRLCIDPHPLS